MTCKEKRAQALFLWTRHFQVKIDLAKCMRSVHEPVFFASPSGRGRHAVAGEGKRYCRYREFGVRAKIIILRSALSPEIFTLTPNYLYLQERVKDLLHEKGTKQNLVEYWIRCS